MYRIKLMLIRIGDEKREMLEQHLTILTNKLNDLHAKGDQEAIEDTMKAYGSVLVNLSHKCLIYADILSLLARVNAAFATQIMDHVLGEVLRRVFVN